MDTASVDFVSYDASIPLALDRIGAKQILASQETVLIKPNLTEGSPPPITTPVECCEAIVNYVRACSKARVVVAEGCGSMSQETADCFRILGYEEMSRRLDVPLLDLNGAELVLLKKEGCRVFREFHMPRIALESYVISVPVLKAHSLAQVTGALKNMMGFAPPAHYQKGGHWKKAAFHNRMHESITELNRYRKPDLSVLDATIGLAEFHLGGARCNPPVNKIVAGFDALEVDRVAARLLGFDWKKIAHLATTL